MPSQHSAELASGLERTGATDLEGSRPVAELDLEPPSELQQVRAPAGEVHLERVVELDFS